MTFTKLWTYFYRVKKEGYELYSAKGTAFQEVFNQVLADMRQLLKQIDTAELNYAELLNMLIR